MQDDQNKFGQSLFSWQIDQRQDDQIPLLLIDQKKFPAWFPKSQNSCEQVAKPM